MAKSATILGLARLEQKIKALPSIAIEKIKAAMEASADHIVRMAKSLVPVDDGDLMNSIGWTWGAPPRGALTLGKLTGSELGKGLTITIYAGNDVAFYARWVEFGTAPHINGGLFAGTEHPGTTAQPFFFVSYRATRKKTKRDIRKAVRDAAREVAKGKSNGSNA